MKYRFMLIVLCIVSSSCNVTRWAPEPRSIASIDQRQDWNIKQGCGEGCVYLYDFLTWNQVKIMVEPLNDNAGEKYKQRLFLVVNFKTPPNQTFTFNPSLSYLILEDGTKIPSKGYIGTCKADENRFKNVDYEKPVELGNFKGRDKANFDPFMLVFDHPAPPISERFSIQINGFYKDNKKIKVPLIHFAPGVEKIKQGSSRTRVGKFRSP